MFGGDLCNTKLFFEGEGYALELKHKDVVKAWVGVPIIATSNNLPSVLGPSPIRPRVGASSAEVVKATADEEDRKAFMNRINMQFLYKDHKKGTPFPYNECELAQYMLNLIRVREARNTLKEVEGPEKKEHHAS